jgi:hypothetical protein
VLLSADRTTTTTVRRVGNEGRAAEPVVAPEAEPVHEVA